jgi:hypothetical protein
VAVLGLCLATVFGCGKSSHPIAPVSGQVTLDGQPLADAHVTFQPMASADGGLSGVGSVGVTDAEGKFTLRTVKPKENGAVVGTHRVWITTSYKDEKDDPHNDSHTPKRDRVPSRYQDGSLTFEVPPEGTDQAKFQLTTK